MEKTYYLISCDDREENNIGVMADSRNTSKKLEKILRAYFDDSEIGVLKIEARGKAYEGKFAASCIDGEGEDFEVMLEKTEVWDD